MTNNFLPVPVITSQKNEQIQKQVNLIYFLTVMCKVSVIVPNYNYERYLPERIDSILNQTYTDFELILLDDASTDGSAALLEKYKGTPHVSHIVVNEKNSGSPFSQWMKGIMLARGEWVWIAEADDLCEPTFLATCMAQVEATPGTSICYTYSQHIDQYGKPIPRKKKYASTGKTTVYDGRKFVEHRLYWDNAIVNASGVLFKRECAVKLKDHPFRTMRYCGDWMFWIEIAMQGNVVNISRDLNYFRQHISQTAKGKNNGQSVIENITIIKHIESLFPTIPPSKRRMCYGRLSRYIRHYKNKELKQTLFAFCNKELQTSLAFDYYYYKIHLHFRFLPWVLTDKKDYRKAIISEI